MSVCAFALALVLVLPGEHFDGARHDDDAASTRHAATLSFTSLEAETRGALSHAVTDALVGHPIPRVGGVSVGVLHRGRAWREARGIVHQGAATPATSSTSFRLASITKTLTAVAVMQLVEEGRLSLDDRLSALLPGAPPPWRPITIRQLLSHTSGIRHYPPKGPERTLNVHLDTDATLALIATRPLATSPGRRFLYTTYGYDVLGAVLERLEARPYAEVLAERILDPIGMEDTHVEDSRRRDPAWPDGLRLTRRGVVVPSPRIDLSSRFAGGGLRGTVDDLLRYSDALLHGHLVSDATLRLMTTPTLLPDGSTTDYGLGFAVYPQRGHLVVAHAGGQPETTTLLFLLPAEDLAIVAATNLEGQGPALSAIASAVVEVLVDGGVVRRDVANRTPADAAAAFVLHRATSWGRALVDDPGLKDADDAEVDAAFARFHALVDDRRLKRDPAGVQKLARSLHQPKEGRVTPLVGATVARVVRDVDQAAYARLSRRGPLALFATWVEVCEASPERCPPPRRPSPALAARVTRLQHAFESVAPAAVLSLRTLDLLDVERAVTLLTPMVGADAHPDFSDDLLAASDRLLEQRPGDAVTLARLNVALHPRAPVPRLALGRALLLVDDEEGAGEALQEAWRLGGAGALPASLWASSVTQLRGLNHPRAALAADALLAVARGHHPADRALVDDDHADDVQ